MKVQFHTHTQRRRFKRLVPLITTLFFLTFFTCEREDVTVNKDSYFKTVSIKESLKFLNSKTNNTNLRTTNTNPIGLTIEVDSAKHEPLFNSNEFITVVPATTTYANTYSRVLVLEINDTIQTVLFNMMRSNKSTPTAFSGFISITNLEGEVITGYEVEGGKLTKQFIKSSNAQSSSRTTNDEPCPFHGPCVGGTICIICEQQLDAVVIVVENNNQGLDPFNDGGSDYPDDYSIPEWDYGDGYPPGGGGGTPSPPCPEGKIKNTNGDCACPEGKVEDVNGSCVDKPCDNDPVPNPKIAPQKGSSGTKGALQGCTRYGGSCSGEDNRTKQHAGIDLKSEYGDPIYAMYSGFIYTTKYDPSGAGYYTRIQSTINGETFLVEYFHLQEDNRILQTSNPLTYVNAGDIIGYQGDSGNLKGAIKKKTVESHVHIEVRVHDGSSQWGYGNFDIVDPRDYLSTSIDDDGVSQTNTNCN